MLSFYYDLIIPSVSSCVELVYMNPRPQPSHYWNRFTLRLQYNPWHPQLSPELTQKFPVYTPTSPDGDPWMPGLFPDIHWGIPSLLWLPTEIPWETHVNPEDTLTYPDGHPWWPELPPDIPWRSPDGPIYSMTSPVGMEILFFFKRFKRSWNVVFKIPGKVCISNRKHINFQNNMLQNNYKQKMEIDITWT